MAVRDLGVIAEMRVAFGKGMTVLTGETGAGKTMVIEALGLLLGQRADQTRVRTGAEAAVVEALFVVGDEDVVVRRVVPAEGRARSMHNGDLVPAAKLAELGVGLVEIHGQHAQQALFGVRSQRESLDRFGGVDRVPLKEARARLAEIDAALALLGGDERARARELDLLRFQVADIEAAGIVDVDEDERLAAEEALLGNAQAHLEAAGIAAGALGADAGATDLVTDALAAISGRTPFTGLQERLLGLQAELGDIVDELRDLVDRLEPDPQRLAATSDRRALLADLRRKYGADLAEVIAFGEAARERLVALEGAEEEGNRLVEQRRAAEERLAQVAARVAQERRVAAGPLGEAVSAHLAELGLPRATFEVSVDGPDPGDDVTFLLAANPGAPPGPLSRVASGGELSRVMLALHMVLSVGPPTLVFDEVDAGIGGSTATQVGRALAGLASDRQVIVVTHLAQVAAFADHHVAVTKSDRGDEVVTEVATLDEDQRVVELSRMLSGSPESRTARQHAGELLASARKELAS